MNRRGGRVRRRADGRERPGARDRDETMKRLWVLIAVCFVDMIGLMIIAPLLTPHARRLGADAWLVGGVVSSFAPAQLLSSPIWRRVSDRYGRRPALIAG